MEKIILAVLIVAVLVISGCTQSNTTQQNDLQGADQAQDQPTIEDNANSFAVFGVKVSYPDTWTTETFLGETRLLPKEERDYLVPSVFKIRADDWTGSLNDYITDYIKNLLGDQSSMEITSIIVADLSAKKIKFNGLGDYEDRVYIHTLFLKDNKAYSITFSTDENTLSDYSSDLQDILDSIEFV